MTDRWVDGDLEAGADDEQPVSETGDAAGAELGAGEGSSFEPEEDQPVSEPPD